MGKDQVKKHENPTCLSLEGARAIQVSLVDEYATRSFQEELHSSWRDAKGDLYKATVAAEKVCSKAQTKVAKQHGFEASSDGVLLMFSAFTPDINVNAEIRHRKALLHWLSDPQSQLSKPIPKGPARCKLLSHVHVVGSDGKPVCDIESQLISRVRGLKENISLKVKIPWFAQHLFIDKTELLDYEPLSKLFPINGTANVRVECRPPEVVEWLSKAKNKPNAVKEAPSELLTDPEFLLPAIQFHVGVLSFLPSELLGDRTFLLPLIQQSGQALEYVNDELKADRDIVLAAVRQDAWSLEFAAPELQADRDVVLAAILEDAWALQFASPELRYDRELIQIAAREDPWILTKVAQELQTDRTAVISAVEKDWWLLGSLGTTWQDDREVVLAAVQQNGWALEYASKARKADSEVVLAAVSRHGEVLRYADRTLYQDRAICLAAVRSSGTILGLIPHDCQDLDIALAAVRKDMRAAPYIAPHLHVEVCKALGLEEMPSWFKSEANKPPPTTSNSTAHLQKHFEVLGLGHTASVQEIKQQYHKLALLHHPDKRADGTPDTTKEFQAVNNAYHALKEALDF